MKAVEVLINEVTAHFDPLQALGQALSETPPSLPAQIERIQHDILEAEGLIEGFREKAQAIEDAHMVDILVAKDEKDKPLYSNEKTLEIELRTRLGLSEVYQDLRGRIEAEEGYRAVLAIRLERLRGEFKLELAERWQKYAELMTTRETIVFP